MKRLLIGAGVAAALLASAAVIVPLVLPKDAIKARVAQEVEAATGWRLRMDGDVSISLLPQLHLSADDVGLAGEAGAQGVEFARASSISFELGWGALFGGPIQVTGIALDKPGFNLLVDREGRTSWAPRQPMKRIEGVFTQFDSGGGEQAAAPAAPEPAAQQIAADAPQEARDLRALTRIGFDDVQIRDGLITYADERSGTRQELSGINGRLTIPALDRTADLDVSAVWNGQSLVVDGQVATPMKLAAGEPADIDLMLKAGGVSVVVDGTLGLSPLAVDLAVDGKAASMAAIMALAGKSGAGDSGELSLAGRVAGNAEKITLQDGAAAVGALKLALTLDADLTGKAPLIAGRIQSSGGSLQDGLRLANLSFPATGEFGTDLRFSATGADAASLLGSLDISGQVAVSGGTVTGLDLASAFGGDESANQIAGINAKLTFAGLDKPVTASGGLSWRGEAFALKGSASPALMLAGLPAPLDIRLEGAKGAAGFEGSASLSGGVDGSVFVETKSLRNLMSWLGRPLAPGAGLGPFRVAGVFAAGDNSVSFRNTAFTLDAISGSGEGTLAFGAVPKLTASLALESLPLDPYLGTGPAQPAAGARAGASSGAAATGGAGGKQAKGWSNAPVDFGGLAALDADLTLTARSISWDKIKFGESLLKVTIADGVLNADLQQVSLYGGSGKGTLTVEGGNRQPQIRSAFSLSGVSARNLLTDATGIAWLDGTGALSYDVNTRGSSEAELIGNLGGEAKLDVINGAILGVNLPDMVSNLAARTLQGWQKTGEARTDFTTLTASFQISNGVAINQDLALAGPLIQMTGSGSTDMPARTLDWRVEPQIVPTLQGIAPVPRAKGEAKTMAGLGVPVVIQGSWDKPQIYPDIQGILQDPQAAYQQLEQVGGDLVKLLKVKPDQALGAAADELLSQTTGGKVQFDVQKVLDGEVSDQSVLKAMEQGFGLPAGFLGSSGPGVPEGKEVAPEEPGSESRPQP